MFLNRERRCECETSDPISNKTWQRRHVSNQDHASCLLQLAHAFPVFNLTKQVISLVPLTFSDFRAYNLYPVEQSG